MLGSITRWITYVKAAPTDQDLVDDKGYDVFFW